jgi:hypothetical protein
MIACRPKSPYDERPGAVISVLHEGAIFVESLDPVRVVPVGPALLVGNPDRPRSSVRRITDYPAHLASEVIAREPLVAPNPSCISWPKAEPWMAKERGPHESTCVTLPDKDPTRLRRSGRELSAAVRCPELLGRGSRRGEVFHQEPREDPLFDAFAVDGSVQVDRRFGFDVVRAPDEWHIRRTFGMHEAPRGVGRFLIPRRPFSGPELGFPVTAGQDDFRGLERGVAAAFALEIDGPGLSGNGESRPDREREKEHGCADHPLGPVRGARHWQRIFGAPVLRCQEHPRTPWPQAVPVRRRRGGPLQALSLRPETAHALRRP